MPVKLWALFFASSIVHKSYFDCVMTATAWKRKGQICSRCWSYGVKYRKKLLQTTNYLWKWIYLKVYSHPIKNVWISSLTLILIFWWIEILRRHRKPYQNFIFSFEDVWKIKFVFYQTLIAFFHTGKPASSRVLVENLYSDGFYMLYITNFMRSWGWWSRQNWPSSEKGSEWSQGVFFCQYLHN